MVDTIPYDNLSQPVGNESDTLTNGKSDGFEFLTGNVGGTLSDLKLTLVDSTPSDGGSVIVRLFSEQDIPVGFGTILTEPNQQLAVLGAVDDATLSLSTNPTDVPITGTFNLAANTKYFIEVTGALGSNAALARATSDAGVGITGNYSYQNDPMHGTSGEQLNGDAYVARVTENIPCFASGTSIHTVRGDVLVEALAVGDLVATSGGSFRSIRWLGHRTIDCRRHPRPQEVMPIRIAAHTFRHDQPARDLDVSPGHAICVDLMGGVLIPAGSLVNGTTIFQFDVETVTYWHVELDEHEVIMAEGLPCESYLEMGNRSFFAENGTVALAALPDAPVRTHADFCRPYYADGPLVDAVRARLGARSDVLQSEPIKRVA